jgi:hypothetical protein
MRLHRFNKKRALLLLHLRQNKEKYIKISTLVFGVVVLTFGIIYFAFAKLSTNNKFNAIQTTVGEFNQGDYHLIAYINGVRSSTIPAKDSGYTVNNVTCDNGATGVWSNSKWGLIITNATVSITKCSVYFINYYTDSSGAAHPELYQGLIPVKYDASGNTVVADITQEWYDYSNHNWANAVLINCADDTVKSKYFDENMNILTSAVGTTISSSDILQYYVWIPRYKYLLWNAANGSSNEQAISITFEDKSATKSAGTTNGTWLTHPAFTFGTTELNGFWAGKFETGGTLTNLKIAPNISPLVSQLVSSMFEASRNEAIVYPSLYGLDSLSIDTHMMRNMEWGAIAYLSSSIYGRYTNSTTCISSGCEIWANLYSSFKTGCAGNSVYATAASVCNAWNTSTGVNASTTGNQYGIYDMSGGAKEYVMGNMVDSSGAFYPSLATFSSTPTSKYYDSYAYDASSHITHSRGLLGDATKETLKTYGSLTGGWYSDYSYFPSGSNSWFVRGGVCSTSENNASVGIYNFYFMNGGAGASTTFRSSISAQ